MNSFLLFCRRYLPWSNSRQSWEERIAFVGIVAAGFALWWYGLHFSPLATIVLWGLLFLTGVILLRRGWLKLFGPVLFYDMVQSGRRGKYILLRCLYAGLLFFLLYSIYVQFEWRYRYAGELPHHVAADIAQTYFEAFMVVQLIAVVILTPAYVAGSIADEKTRKTLEFLLATDLRNREIVFSKLGSRLANLSCFVLTGLPILSFLQFLGGVDPNLILVGFAATALTMLGLAGVSIMASTWCKRPRDAIACAYLVLFGYYAVSIVLWVCQQYMAFASTPGWLDDLVFALNEAITAFNTGNLIFILTEVGMASHSGRLAIVLPEVLARYALFQGIVAGICIGLSVWRLRAIALRQMSATKKRRRWSWFGFSRPPVGDLPMVWKEIHMEGGLRFHWVAWLITLAVVAATFAPVWLILDSHMRYPRGGGWDWLAMEINVWARMMTPFVGSVTLLAVAVRAATCISGERDRQTLDSLLTSPLTAGQILAAKWLGNITSIRWSWLWLGGIWLVAMVLGGLHPLAIPVLIWAWLIYAAFLSMLGCWFSIISHTSQRAIVYTLFATVGLTVGHWLPWFCCGPLLMFSPGFGEGIQHVVMFQAAITPPIALGMLPFYGREFTDMNPDPYFGEMVCFLVTSLFLWLGATVFLWSVTLARFSKLTLRGSEMPWTSSDQRHHDRPIPVRPVRTRATRDGGPKLRGAVLLEEIQELPPASKRPKLLEIPEEPPFLENPIILEIPEEKPTTKEKENE